MQETAFNMCGFIQPSFIVSMLEGNDPDAFNDRQFFVCPKEVEYRYSQLKVPMDPAIPKLDVIFKHIKSAHSVKGQYFYSAEAQRYFITIHDELCTRKLEIIDDEDRRGVLSKAKGQLARLAMIIHCLEQAVDPTLFEDSEFEWKYKIDESSVKQAKIILDYNNYKSEICSDETRAENSCCYTS